MADKLVGARIAFPPPMPPLPIMASKEAKNLMKSPASLIGKENKTSLKNSVLDLCKNFVSLRCRKAIDSTGLSWFYYNNDIDACLQDGPTCGLIALKVAADVLRASGHLAATSNKSAENEIFELLQLSKDSGFTYHGEMFSARDMASLAKNYYDINYKILPAGLEDYVSLVNHIIQGYPIVVPYDSDKNNEPCLKKGHKAHWGVITGFLIGTQQEHVGACEDVPLRKAKKSLLSSNFESNNLFIIARHGKSRHYGLWQWSDLYNSNNNLIEFYSDFKEKSDSRRCLLTEGIQEGLCSKALFFYP